MHPHNSILQGFRLALATLVTMLVLAGCDGKDGAQGPEGPPGTPGMGVVPVSTATDISIGITGVTINSAPVVEFTAVQQDGILVTGLKAGSGGNLRFTIAKLIPGTNGNPSAWQSYVNNGNNQATYDRDGDLVDLGDGRYRYTFKTDITDPTQTGGISYDPSLTHRVAMQLDGFPAHNPTFDFVPAGGSVSVTREIVKTQTCNTCHNKLAMHGGGRVETQYCVTCHNPGTVDPDTGNTVDFTVMIHKIHRGESLPSVVGPDGVFEDDPATPVDESADNGVYQIIGYNNSVHDFSTVVFPQDIRNCTKCHDGSTSEGDAWQTPSIEGCGSCHDDVDFSTGLNHGTGVGSQTNATCSTCHRIDGSGLAPSAAQAHTIPASAPRVASGKFQYNIHSICGANLLSAPPAPPVPLDPPGVPSCAPGSAVTVTFSVTDPTQAQGSGTHGYDIYYDVAGATNNDRDPEFHNGFPYGQASATLNVLTAWNTRDYTNEGGSGTRPSRADSKNALTNATDNSDGTFTITLDQLPVNVVDLPVAIPLTGSGAIAIEGHPRGESDPVNDPGVFDIMVPVKGEVAYFGITDSTPVARRVAVDIETKCDNCHDQLSLHGTNRAENAQLCVLCHNPRGTDAYYRPKDADGLPDETATLDGKPEESIDLKRLIHAIHAGQKDDPATPAVEGHGVREKGLVIYAYGNSSHDYSHVRFPGILSDCTTCHNDQTYELTGRWQSPTQNGILASTIEAIPEVYVSGVTGYDSQATDQRNDKIMSPTAAVCSACHDDQAARWHMENVGTAQFEVKLADNEVLNPYEDCATCHGPGRVADVKVVHGVK